MPPYLVYVLIVFAFGTVWGFGSTVGRELAFLVNAIAFIIVIIVLWEPLIKPLIEKSFRK